MIRSVKELNGGVQGPSSAPGGAERAHPLSDVHAVVLAGVHAWGAHVLDEVICRPLVPIAGQPLIMHVLHWLRQQGIAGASLCANSDTARLRTCLGDGKAVGLALDYYEDVMPRGPAGSTRDAAAVCPSDLYVVVCGTIVPRVNLAEVLAFHKESGAELTVVATPADTHGERADAALHPAGIYIFSHDALDSIPQAGYQDIKETLIPQLHADGKRIVVYTVGDDVIGQVTDTQSYIAVSQWAVEQTCNETLAREGYSRRDEAQIHRSAQVDRSARLIGPVIVEPGCVIEAEAVVVGPTTIGESSVVHRRAVISRSTVWSHCRIGQDAILDRCLLADNSVVDGGLVIRDAVCASPQARPAAVATGGDVPSRDVASTRHGHQGGTSVGKPWPADGPGFVPAGVTPAASAENPSNRDRGLAAPRRGDDQ